MKFFVSLFLLTTALHANPIAMASVEKNWERCVISSGEKSSTVSCAVGYKVMEFPNQHFQISVPMLLPKSMKDNEALALETVKARLEINGTVLKPVKLGLYEDPSLPVEAIRAVAYFDMSKAPAKTFSIVASYIQPNIDGKFIYIPQFEGGKNPKEYREFSVTVFPADEGILSLESKHKQGATTLATRITIKPVHDEIIITRHHKSGKE